MGTMDDKAAKRKFQRELNSGAVSLVLLGLLARRGKPMYGYEIAKRLEATGGGALPMNQGALYPALRSLEKQGLLASRVEPSLSGPPRKYYQITKQGRHCLRSWTQIWQQTTQFVDSVLGGHHESNTARAGSRVSKSS